MKEKVLLRERNLGKWLCLALMTLALLLPAKTAKADNFTLTLNDEWVNGNVPTNTTNFYEFELPAAGWIDITYQGWNIKDSYVCIKNADMTKIYWEESLYSTSDTNPGIIGFTSWMEAGRYKVCVKGRYSGSCGDYRLKGSFEAANNTEKEINNDFHTAMPLVSGDAGKVLGLISVDDRVDFYSIYIPSTQKVQIIFNCMIWDGYFEIWDKDFVKKHSKAVYDCSMRNPRTYTYEETLTAGTWYIKIGPYYKGSQGKYYISWNPKQEIVLASAISVSGGRDMTVGEEVTLYANVLPSNVTNGAVDWSSDNTSVATVDSNGKVTARAAGRAVITARTKDGSNVSGTYNLTVKEKVSSVPVTSLRITGKSTLVAGKKAAFKAIASPSNATNKKVTWTSSNKNLATVSSNGVVRAKRPGKVVITATAKDGSKVSARYTMLIRPKKVNFNKAYSSSYRTIRLGWKKQSNVSGYQVQWSRNKSFRGAKSGVLGGSSTGGTIRGTTSGRVWYIRVRSYVTVDSSRYYGAWSKTRAVVSR